MRLLQTYPNDLTQYRQEAAAKLVARNSECF